MVIMLLSLKDKPALAESVSKLPNKPGVYRMLDANGRVLYVGKAADLKKRVGSYFSKVHGSVKTQTLMRQVVAIEVDVTRSETEAFLLESNLIKSLRPKYNVLLRDDKTYPYIRVTAHPFPRLEAYRSKHKPKGQCYGPYPSISAVRETFNTIQKVFKIRNCSDTAFQGRTRPCLQYQIKRCTAPCVNFISQEAYQQSVKDAIQFLQGKSQLILDMLTERMKTAVACLKFEEAAILRDQIKQLRLIQEQQGVSGTQGGAEADVIAIEVTADLACVQHVMVRQAQIVSNQRFFPKLPKADLLKETPEAERLWEEVFEAFLRFYYLDEPTRIPGLIITDHPLQNRASLEKALTKLRGKACQIQTKPRGIKTRWLDFARNNLRVGVEAHRSSSAMLTNQYQVLNALLHRSEPIQRMECFDISHTQGQETVASCVVFDQNGPVKAQYRRFNVTNITPGDDYAAMDQVVRRRLKHLLQEDNLPDLLIIDGGKGQVSVAKRVIKELQISGMSMLGIAKGPARKAGQERLILTTQTQEIMLEPEAPPRLLLQYIRDEAHRFAITTHRKKRQKASLLSSLDTIEGIGPRRRRALIQRFGGMRELMRAPLEEIAKVSGINQKLALRIYQSLHSE